MATGRGAHAARVREAAATPLRLGEVGVAAVPAEREDGVAALGGADARAAALDERGALLRHRLSDVTSEKRAHVEREAGGAKHGPEKTIHGRAKTRSREQQCLPHRTTEGGALVLGETLQAERGRGVAAAKLQPSIVCLRSWLRRRERA